MDGRAGVRRKAPFFQKSLVFLGIKERYLVRVFTQPTVPLSGDSALITRTHAAATLLSAGLVAGATSLVIAQDAAAPSSADLFKKGMTLLDSGSEKEARETLLRVDALQLPEADRAAYFAALKRVEPKPAVAAVAGEVEKPAKAEAVAPAKEEPSVGEAPAVKPPVKSPAGGDALADARSQDQAALVAAGDDAMAKHLYTKAAQSYAKAHDLAPDDVVIAGKLASAQSAQSKHSGSALAVDLMRYDVEHQRTLAQFKSDMEDGKTRLAARDYAGANNMASAARAHANQGREWLAVSEFDAMQAEVNAFVASIDADSLQRTLEGQRDKDFGAKRDAAAQASADKAARVNQLLVTARALQRNGQNAQALNAAQQALAADPGNMAADLLTEILRDELYLRESDRLLKDKANHTATLGLENREAVIPYTDLINYPTDWPQMSQRRIAAATGVSIESDVDRNTRHLLDEHIVDASFTGDSLEAALNYVRDTTGVNMVVLWGAIETAGVRRDRAITQPLKRVSAAQLLKIVLENVSSDLEGESRLGYAVENGIVKVATRKELKNNTVENIYDIHDLLVQIPQFTDAPNFSLTSALSSSGGGGGGGGASIFGDTAAAPDAIDDNKVVEDLINRIKDHVGTRSEWDDNLSVISSYRSQLMVKTTPENHRALAKLLEAFRQTRSVQISVESRFLFVDNNFLEEFGVDLDLTLPGNNGLSPISVQQGHAPTQNGGGSGMTARPSGSLTPAAFKSSSGAQPQALTLGASYLNDLQVDLLVTATQAHRTGITLTAPRITFFNGQRAYVLVGRQVSFVSSLTPVQNTGSATPTISTVQAGVVLDVEGTASADRRYVTLTLRPSLANLKDPIRQLEIRSARPQNNNVNNNGGVGGLLGGSSDTLDTGIVLGVIETPELELTQIRTSVSIPDRGTLMTGGQRLISETQVEAGVPVLSKIPLIDRLFANSSQVKDERTLLILIKPTIILQNEEEESRWPGGPQDWSAFNVVAQPVEAR